MNLRNNEKMLCKLDRSSIRGGNLYPPWLKESLATIRSLKSKCRSKLCATSMLSERDNVKSVSRYEMQIPHTNHLSHSLLPTGYVSEYTRTTSGLHSQKFLAVTQRNQREVVAKESSY